MSAHIDVPSDKIAAFCRRWQITELALFGSVLRDDFGPDSDVDVLVGFGEDARRTLFGRIPELLALLAPLAPPKPGGPSE